MKIRARIGNHWTPVAVTVQSVERDTATVRVPALGETWMIWRHGLLCNLTPKSGVCATLHPEDCETILSIPHN